MPRQRRGFTGGTAPAADARDRRRSRPRDRDGRPGPGGACGSDAMSPDAAPRRAPGPSPFLAAPALRWPRPRPRAGRSGRAPSTHRCPERPARCSLLAPAEPARRHPPGRPRTVRFASYDFPENQILVEVYAEAARRAGLPVSVQHGIGTREVVAPALQQGVVDVVVDYLGTALASPGRTARTCRGSRRRCTPSSAGPSAGGASLALDAAQAEDQNGFAVTTAFAAEHGVGRLSDLADLAPELTFGGPPECPDRPLLPAGPGGRLRAAVRAGAEHAVARRRRWRRCCPGQIDVGLLETTDARLAVAPVDAAGRRPRRCSRRRTSSRWCGRDALDRWGERPAGRR